MHNFKIGQKVKVKNWEKMEKEYGIGVLNDIETPIRFVSKMKKYCGDYATILKFGASELEEEHHKVYLKFNWFNRQANCWNWCIEMIEPLTKKEEKNALH